MGHVAGSAVPQESGHHGPETVIAGPNWVEAACEWLSSLSLLAMVVLIGAEAIARNLFNTSLQVTDEVGGYLLVAVTFLSMSVAEAHGAYHRVELVQVRLPPRAQLRSQLVFDALSLLTAAILTWQLTRLALNSWHSEDVAPTPLQTPLWLPQSVMSIGTAILCLALLRTMSAKLVRLHRMGRP
jgi:TRAP-type C4-dicarboxylate transport system permease small subunit